MKTLSVSEYGAGAALACAGIKMVDVKPPRMGSRRCEMLFDDTDGRASETLRKHLSGDLQASTLEFADSLQRVKSALFAAKGA
jgi:hypothetical protein